LTWRWGVEGKHGDVGVEGKQVSLNHHLSVPAMTDLVQQDMAVRGAPAIAIAGALALAVDLHNNGKGQQFASAQDAQHYIDEQMAFLVTRYLSAQQSVLCWQI